MDAGFFDIVGTTRLEWFDLEGRKLGQRSNSAFGIENFEIRGGGISSWAFGIVEDEPAGFAIDNVISTPIGSSVVFREKSDDGKDGSWGVFDDEIPGFDHVGLNVEDIVYESHPGYSGAYRSADGEEVINIAVDRGVQAVHSLETFKFASTTATTKVVDVEEIPISETVAAQMRSAIQGVESASFQGIDYSTIEGIQQTYLPGVQKGGGDSFTCVGLVEWSAEQAGVNDGQGYIPNDLEFITVPTGLNFDFPSFELETIDLPTLSPELLYWSMTGQDLVSNIRQWVQGFFDPVDMVVTDPLGRRLGYSALTGELSEIPFAFYSGDGGVEQFLVPNPIPGNYLIRLEGQGEQVLAGTGSDSAAVGYSGFMEFGDVVHNDVDVEVRPGTTGDVDENGAIDSLDLAALNLQLGRFTQQLGDPADLSGDGLIDQSDADLLRALIELSNPSEVNSCELTSILPSNSWRMISLPQLAQGARAGVGAVLGADINAVYGQDWVVFGYDPAADRGYTRLAIDDLMEAGAGYWVIQNTGEDVEFDMPAGSILSATPSDLPLCSEENGCVVQDLETADAPQFDMVGNPYCKVLNIGEQRISTASGDCSVAEGCAVSDVVGMESDDLLLDSFWTYTGPESSATGYTKYSAADSMMPWTGYWLSTMEGSVAFNPELVFLP